MKHSLKMIAIAASLLFNAGAAMASDIDEFASANQVADSELDQTRGTGTPTIFNISDLTAELTGNSVSNSVTGNNSIDASALAGVNGMTNIIQNTGNNVIVQATTTVNVTFVGSSSINASF